MGSAFVFDPDASYGRVDAIREANEMPEGVHLVASVTGPWKLVSIVDYDGLAQLPARVDGVAGEGGGSGDPETATTVLGTFSKVKRTEYANEMAFVRIQVRGDADPMDLLDEVAATIGSNEVDAVVGDFDILACAVADDETNLAAKILAVRAIGGIKRTTSLRVIDFVSESPDAPDGHRIPA
jgi:hypothetical protein